MSASRVLLSLIGEWGDRFEVGQTDDGRISIYLKDCSHGPGARAVLTQAEAERLRTALAVVLSCPDTVKIRVGELPPVEDGDWGNVLPVLVPQGQIVRVEPVRGYTGRLLAVKVSVRDGVVTTETIYSPSDTIEVIRNDAIVGMEFL